MAKDLLNFNGLTSKLDEELAWRRKELTIIKTMIPREKNSIQNALLRSAIPLLYAHWEGFAKVTLSCYLQFVANQYLKNSELQYPFVALSLQKIIGQLGVNNIIDRTKLIESLFLEYDKQSNLPKKNIINTKSNLKFEVFQEILHILNIEDTHFVAQKSLINDLVDLRNNIAHGEYSKIDLLTYENFHNEIIALFNALKTQIENCAIEKKYKR